MSMTRQHLKIFAVIAALLFAGAVEARLGQAEAQAPAESAAGRGMMAQGQMGQMMMERQKMMAQMQAAEKKLDELVAKMNAARGAEKVEPIAAVVNELVAQHKRMHDGMMTMMQQMTPPPATPSGASRNPPGAGHEEHHPQGK
jgi:hypothetical protein